MKRTIYLLIFQLFSLVVLAQDWELVWADEFDGTQLDETCQSRCMESCTRYITDL